MYIFIGVVITSVEDVFNRRRTLLTSMFSTSTSNKTFSNSVIGVLVAYNIFYTNIAPSYNLTVLKSELLTNVTKALNASVHSGRFNHLLQASNSTRLPGLVATTAPTVYPPNIKVVSLPTHSPSKSPVTLAVISSGSKSTTTVSSTVIIIVVAIGGFFVVACILFLIVKYIFDDNRKLKYITSQQDNNLGHDMGRESDVEFADMYLSNQQQQSKNNSRAVGSSDKLSSQQKKTKSTPSFEPYDGKKQSSKSSKKSDVTSNKYGYPSNDVESNRWLPSDRVNSTDYRNRTRPLSTGSRAGVRGNVNESKGAAAVRSDNTDNLTYESNPRSRLSGSVKIGVVDKSNATNRIRKGSTESSKNSGELSPSKVSQTVIANPRPISVHLDEPDISRRVQEARKKSLDSSPKTRSTRKK